MKRPLVVQTALQELIRHLPPLIKKSIRGALEEIIENPHVGKPLSEELVGLRSYKLGKIRIIYRIEEGTLTLIDIGPRKTIYQKVALELKNKIASRFGFASRSQ